MKEVLGSRGVRKLAFVLSLARRLFLEPLSFHSSLFSVWIQLCLVTALSTCETWLAGFRIVSLLFLHFLESRRGLPLLWVFPALVQTDASYLRLSSAFRMRDGRARETWRVKKSFVSRNFEARLEGRWMVSLESESWNWTESSLSK